MANPIDPHDDNDSPTTEEEFWEQDAERLNEMSRIARHIGVTSKVGRKPPPKLREDGSEETGDETAS